MILTKGIATKAPRPILSKRQEQVRRMVVEDGMSTKQIMVNLNVAEQTVKMHMTALYKAFGVKSKYELMYKELMTKLKEKGVEL